jgi:hypothetical protein
VRRLDPETSRAIVARRLRAQRLTGAGFSRPEDVVGALGAVQAQDYGPAKWSVACRSRGATDARLERAFDAGDILRTHVLRPTWHFVLPADVRWLLTATAPRVQARCAYRYRQLGLDAATLLRGDEVLAAALRGGADLTRAEAEAVFVAAGIDTDGQRLPYLLMHAELEAVVCSGPRRGKQHTWALLEERAPQALELARGEALGELARRYFTSHGPATPKDFATWASLTLAEARAAAEAAAPALRREEAGSLVFWADAGGSRRTPALRSPLVRLVQGYDEYLMGYTETKQVIAPPGRAWSASDRPVANLLVLLDGRIAGYWRRTIKLDEVVVELELLDAFDEAQSDALEAEAARYAAFLGLRPVVRVVDRLPSTRPRGEDG